MPNPRIVFRASKGDKRKVLSRGKVYGNPLEMEAKVKEFGKELKAHPRLAAKLVAGRRYTRWLVAKAGNRVYVAPIAYALFDKTTLSVLQNATHGDLVAEGVQELARVHKIERGSLYDRALQAVRKLTKRPNDEITLFSPKQRCLYSADSKLNDNEFKRWSTRSIDVPGELHPNDFNRWCSQAVKAPAVRKNSRDDVVRAEEFARTRPEALALMIQTVRQHSMYGTSYGRTDESFQHGHHFRLVFRGASGKRYVFMPRKLTLNNLHGAVRDVLAEALEYEFRYNDATLKFVSLFSHEIESDNEWAIQFLNRYKILVVTRNVDETLCLVGKVSTEARKDLKWLDYNDEY